MIVTLLKESKIFSITLPEKVNGQFWLTDCDETGRERRLAGIEAVNSEWVLKSNRTAVVLNNDGMRVKNTIIRVMNFYHLEILEDKEKALIFTESVTTDRQVYQKYVLKSDGAVTVGRNRENGISFPNIYVSGRHAVLALSNGRWSVEDLKSKNGTFVNERKITSCDLSPGDVIYIMGLKMIVGREFLAFNNPDGIVEINTDMLKPFINQEEAEEEREEEPETVYFYRAPRFIHDIEGTEIKIDPPPPRNKIDEIPMALMLGPSLTMGLASMSTAIFTVMDALNNGRPMTSTMPTMIMAGSMLCGMTVWPVATKKYEKVKKSKAEKLRQERYRQYLIQMHDQIIKESCRQRELLLENQLSADQCAVRVYDREQTLWERAIGQKDFLTVRLGIGELPLNVDIRYPEKHFSLEYDNLQDDLYALMNQPKKLEEAPICYSLLEKPLSGIIGEDRRLVLDFVKGLLVQLTALHGYDELKLAFITGREERGQWEFARWLPHVWDNGQTIRFFANDSFEVKELSSLLEKEWSSREEAELTIPETVPYYVVIAADRELAEKCEFINVLKKQKGNRGFSLLSVCRRISDLPKECQMVVEIKGEHSSLYDRTDMTGVRQSFRTELPEDRDLTELAKKMANIRLNLENQIYSLPGMLTFLEMFGIGKIEHLNPLTRWKENDPAVSLQAPVGVNAAGQLFQLDLHERFQGPHGLVAGMTGSGKSEFIITYILAMAVNYHPDEVAFILIDYKGGGLAGAFEDQEKKIKLPHLAGTITNLDGASVKRSLISIQSELRRRQAVFNEARRVSNEGTMDIYKYQKLHRSGIVPEAVPHLFIISDEFAELKTQQPEFMEQLVSAARIGRSLGVHLILATQKPSGVVDEQIWSNSRFRVCLKVQEKSDSMDMIKRPDAAELSATGRFYLQVGFNEFFDMGQSAWCGAPYIPSEKPEMKKEKGVKVLDNLGRVVKEVRPRAERRGKTGVRQIVAIVKYLSDLASEEGIAVRPLWMKELPAKILISRLKEKYGFTGKLPESKKWELNPLIGELDDPFNQSQRAITVPITGEGNAVIYGAAGSGKTVFLTTLLYELLEQHGPDSFQAYILDFASETLRVFQEFPQVGDVILSHESEKIGSLFKLLRKELIQRKRILADFGGDLDAYRQKMGGMPNLGVFIHNYAAFTESCEEYQETVGILAREGTKYGIYFVITSAGTNGVPFRLLQNFKQVFMLQLNDKMDYLSIIGSTDGVYPSKLKGRGIVKFDNTYEIQTAFLCGEGLLNQTVEALCRSCLQEAAGKAARPVPVLPELVNVDSMKAYLGDCSRIPVGVDRQTLETCTVNVAETVVTLVASQVKQSLGAPAQGLAEALAAVPDCEVRVLDVQRAFKDDNRRGYYYTDTGFEEQVDELFELIVMRHNQYKKEVSTEGFNRVVYLIYSCSELMGLLSEDGRDKMRNVLEKSETVFRVSYILCDTAAAITSYNLDGWYRKQCAGAGGIWVGDGVTDQYHLKINKVSPELYQELGDRFGVAVSGGRYRIVKLMLTKLLERDDSDG